jgi:hypothetical protein
MTSTRRDDKLELVDRPTGDRIEHGITGQARPGTKAMQGSGTQRPTTPPPKPSDAKKPPKN